MGPDDSGQPTTGYADWVWWRQCGRKVVYDSMRSASHACIKMVDKNGGRFQAYQCPFCPNARTPGVADDGFGFVAAHHIGPV